MSKLILCSILILILKAEELAPKKEYSFLACLENITNPPYKSPHRGQMVFPIKNNDFFNHNIYYSSGFSLNQQNRIYFGKITRNNQGKRSCGKRVRMIFMGFSY